MAPVPRDSGRIRSNLHKPQRYNRSLRRVFYISAMVAANRPGESRDYYQRKRAQGKRVVQAQIGAGTAPDQRRVGDASRQPALRPTGSAEVLAAA